jgi:N-acetyltransferase
MTSQNHSRSSEPLGPCLLEGHFVRLEPMRKEHAEGLLEAGKDLDWAWMSVRLSNIGSVKRWIEDALAAEEKGEEYGFVVRIKPSLQIVGSTRYMDTQPRHKITEVGWTWYSTNVRGTVVNPECKYLLLRHAFDDWHANRVQLKTDNKNLHSQRAILKLGAKFEGKLRNHRIRPDGTIRDTMMYSMIPEEWPEVSKNLLSRIETLGKQTNLEKSAGS